VAAILSEAVGDEASPDLRSEESEMPEITSGSKSLDEEDESGDETEEDESGKMEKYFIYSDREIAYVG
jgi:hypothetical protein